MKNKIFLLIFAIVVSTTMLFAESGTCGENITWELIDSVLTISGTGAMPNYSSSSSTPWYSQRKAIKTIIQEEDITSIGNYAFSGCSNLISISIPSSVTNIGNYAFYDCSRLKSVSIPSSVTTIGNSAFSGCNLLIDVYITDLAAWCAISFGNTFSNPLHSNVHYAPNLYLNNEPITNLVIPNGVTNIGNYAFYDCSRLKSVSIPSSVTSIGSGAFSDCTGLTSVHIDDITAWCAISFGNASSNPLYYAHNLYQNNEPITNLFIQDGVETISNYAFCGCTGLTSVTIGNSVTSIGESVFSGCNSLTSVYINANSIVGKNNTSSGSLKNIFGSQVSEYIIGDSVTNIGNYAFFACTGLTSVTIGNSVSSIGDCAFQGCSGLSTVTIPNSVTSIGWNAFRGCSSMTSVTIGNSVSSIGDCAFQGCSGLSTVTIPNSVTNIGESAFRDCSGLSIVTIGASVTVVKKRTFYGCSSLTSVTIGNSVTSIMESAFDGCSSLNYVNLNSNAIASQAYSQSNSIGQFFGSQVSEYIIGDSVTNIGNYAFYGCGSLTSVTIGNSVTNIGENAFNGCSSLTSVTIGNSVTNIGENAFNGCSGLTSVIISDIAAWCAISYGNTYSSNPLYYAHNLFLNDSQITELVIPNNVESIGNYAFHNCSGLSSVTIPNSVRSVGILAFSGCSGMTAITIGNSVTNIGGGAFSGCTNLTSVTIPNSVTNIGDGAFSDCTGLTSVEIPSSVTNIKSYTFYNCRGLTSMTIPNSVTNIGIFAFSGCSGMTAITIGNSVTNIGGGAFSGCTDLTSVEIPNSVTSIGINAFQGCSGLSTVTIPNSVTNIENNAFYNVPNIVYNGEATGSPWGAKSVNGYVDGYLVYRNEAKTELLGCSSAATGKIIIPISVTTIGDSAFSACTGLTTIEWNAIHCSDFDSDSNSPFYNIRSQITSFTFGENVEHIPAYLCFGMNKLTSISIPNSVTSIGNAAFSDCSALNSVYINDIAAWCAISFENDNANPLYYARNLFLNDAEITNLVIPDGVTSIGNYAFINCIGLTSVTLPNSITNFGDGAFGNCYSLTSMLLQAETPPSLGNNVFNGDIQLASIYVPCETMDTYKKKTGWSTYSSKIKYQTYNITTIVQNGSVIISPEEFTICSNIMLTATPNDGYHFIQWSDGNTDNPRAIILTNDTTFTAEFSSNMSGLCGDNLTWSLTDNVLSIVGNGDMWDEQPWIGSRTEITNVDLPLGLTHIGNNAFENCSSLTYIEIPDSVMSIGSSAFSGCNNITSVIWNAKNCSRYDFGSQVTSFVFGHEVEIIPESICSGMNKLTFISIPNSVTSIGNAAFSDCSALNSVTIGNSVSNIGDNAFKDCVKLTNIIIPASVTEIGSSAFMNGNRLQRITLGSGIETIGENAFANCPYIITVHAYMEFPPIINTNVFEGCGDLSGVDCYVQESSLAFYRKTNVWKEFNLLIETEPEPTDINNIFIDNRSDKLNECHKFYRNGQILILRGEKVYTLQGQEVR